MGPAAGRPAISGRPGWTGGSGCCWWLRPASIGSGCRACAPGTPGTSRAPAGCPTTASGAAWTSTRSTAARSAPPTPRPAGWRSGSARAGPGSSRARWARPGASAAALGSPIRVTRTICMSASPARPGQVADDRRRPGLPRLGPADHGRTGRRGGRGLPGAGRLAAGPSPVRRPESAMILAGWLLSLPFRLLAALGLRRSVILACLFVLAVTIYGVAEDLGLVEPPAQAAPARKPPAGQPQPSRTATADIPAGYLRRYQAAAGRCPGLSWTVLAAIGKVESDHGRSRLPGVRSGWNIAGAAGPMQFGIGVGRAGNAWVTYGRDFDRDGRTSVYDPGDAIPAAARYLCAAGAPRRLDRALYTYNHSWAYVAKVKTIAARYQTRVGGRP